MCLRSHHGKPLLQGTMVSFLLSISSETSSPGQLRLLQQPACQVNVQLQLHVNSFPKQSVNYIVLIERNDSFSPSIHFKSSYKVREQSLLQSISHHRKHSTQSDTALLPSNVYFQRTLSPESAPFKTGSRAGRQRGIKVSSVHVRLCSLLFHFTEHLLSISKQIFGCCCDIFFHVIRKFFTGFQDEETNRTLDQAIEVARSMKRTTDRMAKRLSTDLAKAQLHRKPHSMQPLGGRKHQAL